METHRLLVARIVCSNLLVPCLCCSCIEEDIKLHNQTFNWPGRMDPIFEVSQQRLATRREKAENELNDRYVPAISGCWSNEGRAVGWMWIYSCCVLMRLLKCTIVK